MPVSDAVASPQRTTVAGKRYDQSGLHVAVVRLLALALDISGGWSPAPPTTGLLIPCGYRDWPQLTSIVQSYSGPQELRFYVCPRALLTADDRSFPVGTVFVVESEPCSTGIGAKGSTPSVFVMEKCAGMTRNDDGTTQSELWIYASWGSGGHLTTADPRRCGICRLPWLTPGHN
ncbi:MAG: hypothetical protein ABS70_02905 [Nitrospira sp. SCN 59-13]|nr:MAG: hypothetical protein ABS70_02905 [Nitrospira sp. SCN 59-13]